MPLSATGVSPPHLNLGLHGTVAEIDSDQISLVIVHPTPGHQILKTRVIRPTRSPAQAIGLHGTLCDSHLPEASRRTRADPHPSVHPDACLEIRAALPS